MRDRESNVISRASTGSVTSNTSSGKRTRQDIRDKKEEDDEDNRSDDSNNSRDTKRITKDTEKGGEESDEEGSEEGDEEGDEEGGEEDVKKLDKNVGGRKTRKKGKIVKNKYSRKKQKGGAMRDKTTADIVIDDASEVLKLINIMRVETDAFSIIKSLFQKDSVYFKDMTNGDNLTNKIYLSSSAKLNINEIFIFYNLYSIVFRNDFLSYDTNDDISNKVGILYLLYSNVVWKQLLEGGSSIRDYNYNSDEERLMNNINFALQIFLNEIPDDDVTYDEGSLEIQDPLTSHPSSSSLSTITSDMAAFKNLNVNSGDSSSRGSSFNDLTRVVSSRGSSSNDLTRVVEADTRGADGRYLLGR